MVDEEVRVEIPFDQPQFTASCDVAPEFFISLTSDSILSNICKNPPGSGTERDLRLCFLQKARQYDFTNREKKVSENTDPIQSPQDHGVKSKAYLI